MLKYARDRGIHFETFHRRHEWIKIDGVNKDNTFMSTYVSQLNSKVYCYMATTLYTNGTLQTGINITMVIWHDWSRAALYTLTEQTF